MGPVNDERGDIIVAGLLKLVATLLALGLVLFDAGALIVNQVQLDEAARVAATAGARAWASAHDPATVEDTVRNRLARHPSVALEGIAIEDAHVTVSVTRAARVVLVQHMAPLAKFAQGRAASTSEPGSSWP